MHRFYIPKVSLTCGKLSISEQQILHYMRDVLHLKPAEPVLVFDSGGSEYAGIIDMIQANKAIITVKEKIPHRNKSATALTIACALPKRAKFDDIIDKLTQLGVVRIIPLFTGRVIVKLDKDARASRHKRWQRIVISAAQQSQRSSVPILDDVTDIKKFLRETAAFDLKLIPNLSGERKELKDVLRNSYAKNILVVIGPEGDFTPEEVAMAEAAGFVSVSLGEQVLRVDTAAVAVAGFIMLNNA